MIYTNPAQHQMISLDQSHSRKKNYGLYQHVPAEICPSCLESKISLVLVLHRVIGLSLEPEVPGTNTSLWLLGKLNLLSSVLEL